MMMIAKLVQIKILGILFFVFSISPAFAQNLDLKSLNQKVNNFIATNEKNNQDVAKAMNLLTQIQQEFQSIRGHVEASKVLQEGSDKVYQDLDVRVSALEDKINQMHQLLKEIRSASAASAPTSPASGANVAQQSKEYDEFQGIVNLVNAEDFRGAASGFMGFIKKYPNSPYIGNAQYWLAESFYSMGDFTKAIAEFQTLVDKYPQSPRVKEAIFKQGSAFMRLKKYTEAKLFFQKVIASYSGTPEAVQSKARLLRIEELEQGATVASASTTSAQAPVVPTAKSVPVQNNPSPPTEVHNSPRTQDSSAPLF